MAVALSRGSATSRVVAIGHALAHDFRGQPCLPCSADLDWQPKGIDAGIVLFQVGPEAKRQRGCELVQCGVVQRDRSRGQIGDQHVTDRARPQAISVHQLSGGLLPGALCDPEENVGRVRWEGASIAEQAVGEK